MSNFLKNNQKTYIRVVISEDIVVFEPTEEQKEEIRSIILAQVEPKDGANIEGEINYDAIRYIIRECVKDGAFIDEYTDDEIEAEFKNGKANIKRLQHEVFDIIEEVLQEFQYMLFNLYKDINSVLNALNSNVEEKKMYDKVQKMFKKQKINVNVEEIIKHKDNPQKITELIDEAAKQKINKTRTK